MPTKFVQRGGSLRAGPAVAPGSVLVADLLAEACEIVIDRYARGHLLDLGCGTVPLFGSYAGRVQSVTCVDWASSVHQLPHADFLVDLSQPPWPLASDAYDTVLLSDVLEHLPDPRAVMREAHRIMAPDGALILTVPFMYPLHETPYDYYRYTEFGLRELAETAGLSVVVLQPYGGYLEVLGDLLLKGMAASALGGGAVTRGVSGLVRGLARVGRVRRWRSSTGGRFPLGYACVFSKAAAGTTS